MKTPLIALAIGLFTSSLYGDTLTGRVLDSNGLPVAGMNIDAKSGSGGGDGNIMNDGTDALGFFSVTINPGTYRLLFQPPTPPAALGLVLRIDDQLISGVTNIGTLILAPAVALSGHVAGPSGLPVSGINLDVVDLATGDNIDLVSGFTDLAGNFLIAVPIGPIELRLDTGPVLGPLLAPDFLTLDSTSTGSIGSFALEPGFAVTAALLDSGFVGIENMDVDVINTLTGKKLYTPGDNTDVNGFVDFVVPAGIFDMEFCPPIDSDFVPHLASNVIVSSTLSLGLITLFPGVRLSGTVTSHLGAKIQGVDIDVRLAGTSNSLLVCADSSDAAGAYSIVVPSGTYDVSFAPSFALPLGSRVLSNLLVGAATTRNPVLPFCGMGGVIGSGSAGSGGLVPQIAPTGGSLRLGNPGWGFSLSNALGGSYGVLFMALGANCMPPASSGSGRAGLQQARIVQRKLLYFKGTPGLAGAGNLHVDLPLPTNLALAGMFISVSAQIFDPAALKGRSNTPILCGQLCQ